MPSHLLKTIQDLAGQTSEFDFQDHTLLDAIQHLETQAEKMCGMKGKKISPRDFSEYVKPLIDTEALSKRNKKSWRFVVDMPEKDGTYNEDPIIQICAGPPSYHRIVCKFEAGGVITRFEKTCVEKEPTLSLIVSDNSGGKQSLADVKNFYDDARIQRIAILGSARVFAHPKLNNPNEPSSGRVVLSQSNIWAQQYNNRVEKELNKFLDVMESKGTEYTTVNGGWAGKQEETTGVPLISSLVGAISDASQGYFLPPITVMPQFGAFDRVVAREDVYLTNEAENIISRKGGRPVPIHTYFEVPGIWGDDSKYLVGLSTGLVVFEPYGFWTNIEIANGVAQGKPVAVIADPKNLEPGGEYSMIMNQGADFAEIKIPLPGHTEGSYRLYRDCEAAAKWIHEVTVEKLNNPQTGKEVSEITKAFKSALIASSITIDDASNTVSHKP